MTAQIRAFYSLDNVNGYRKVIRAEYNNQDQLTKLTYPNGMIVTYRYDQAGRLAAVDDAFGRPIAAYTYWPDGKVQSKRLYSRAGVIQTIDYQYNARGWLTDINSVDAVSGSASGTANHYAVQLKYDQGGANNHAWYNGNVAKYTAKVSPTGTYWSLTQKFDYDGLDQLTADSCFGGYPAYGLTKIAYDLNSNVDSVSKPGVVYDYQYYPNSNRVKQVTNLYPGADNFRYTPSGSMDSTKNLTLGVQYDSEERMIRRTRPGVLTTIDTVNYWYDESGHRIGREYRYHYTVACNDSLPIEMAMGGGGDQMSTQGGIIEDSITLDSGLILDSTPEFLPDSGTMLVMGYGRQDCVEDTAERCVEIRAFWWRGQDLNLRPSGYESDLISEYETTPDTKQ